MSRSFFWSHPRNSPSACRAQTVTNGDFESALGAELIVYTNDTANDPFLSSFDTWDDQFLVASTDSPRIWFGHEITLGPVETYWADQGILDATCTYETSSDGSDGQWFLFVFYDGSGNIIGVRGEGFADKNIAPTRPSFETRTHTARAPIGTRKVGLTHRCERNLGTELSVYLDKITLDCCPDNTNRLRQSEIWIGDDLANLTEDASSGSFSLSGGFRWGYTVYNVPEVSPGVPDALGLGYRDFALDSALETEVDAGDMSLRFAVELGDLPGEDDRIRMWVECLDVSDTILATIETEASRTNYDESFELVERSGAIPANTRKFRVWLNIDEFSSGANQNACFQNFWFDVYET